MAVLNERARAKVNLTLHVLGRRADGYHDLESLVAFADCADGLTFCEPAGFLAARSPARAPPTAAISPTISSPRLRGCLGERVPQLKSGAFVLDKHLPAAAGIGGGSADAAATLRLLAAANGLAQRRSARDRRGAGRGRRRAGVPAVVRLHDARRRRAGDAHAAAAAAVRADQSRRAGADEGRVRGDRPEAGRYVHAAGRRRQRCRLAAAVGEVRRNGSSRSHAAATISSRSR